jgi:hypothetical protein
MKKLIPIVLLFVIKTNAQTYYKFPDSNAVWTETQSSVTKFAVKGDSIYNTFTYKKYYMVNDTNLSTATYTYFAMVRQDIPNKKVFGIKKDSTSEKLLYNFNLNVNDSVRVFNLFALYVFNYSNGNKLKVYAKDSVLINGNYRKRLKLGDWGGGSAYSDADYDYWVEGIGSVTYGIFNSGTSGILITDACFPILLCQKQNGLLNYLNPTYNSCFAIQCTGVGISKQNVKNEELKIYPNPFNRNFSINTTTNELKKLVITNTLGQTIYTAEFYQSNYTLDLPQIPSGAYIATLYLNNQINFRTKLIKQ